MPPSNCAAPWVSLKLGRSLNQVDLFAPKCPAGHASVHEKAPPFNATAETISGHLANFDFAELSACLTAHVPGTHVYSVSQANAIEHQLLKAPYSTLNLTPVCFLTDSNSQRDRHARSASSAQAPPPEAT